MGQEELAVATKKRKARTADDIHEALAFQTAKNQPKIVGGGFSGGGTFRTIVRSFKRSASK